MSGRIAVGLALAAALALAGAPAPAAAATHTVVMEGFTFKPQTLEVKSGDTVLWVNRDILPHTATATANAFDSKTIKPGGKSTWKAGAAGQYAYYCALHPNMKAVVQVR
jgi:plastocyanin